MRRRQVRGLVAPDGDGPKQQLHSTQDGPQQSAPSQEMGRAQRAAHPHGGHDQQAHDRHPEEPVDHVQVNVQRRQVVESGEFGPFPIVPRHRIRIGRRPEPSVGQGKIRHRQPGVPMPHGCPQHQLSQNQNRGDPNQAAKHPRPLSRQLPMVGGPRPPRAGQQSNHAQEQEKQLRQNPVEHPYRIRQQNHPEPAQNPLHHHPNQSQHPQPAQKPGRRRASRPDP